MAELQKAMMFFRSNNKRPAKDASAPAATRSKPRSRPRPAPKVENDDEDLLRPRPSGPYQEFRLMSTARHGWKYDVFKFDARKTVDMGVWAPPVKLNRKDPAPRSDDDDAPSGPITPMLGLDGKPVIGPDGQLVMMQDGRPVQPKREDGEGKEKEPEPPKKRKPFQKKTRQVHMVPDEVRQLRKDERFPWVLEDASGKETWIGRMENADKAETYAFFLPTPTHFNFIPAHRWYKLQKKPTYKTLGMEEAEAEYARIQKNQNPEFWRNRNRAALAAMAEGTPINLPSFMVAQPSLVHGGGGQSVAAGGRRLKMVDKGGQGLFGDDDDEGVKASLRKRRGKELGEEGDLDEMEYEDEFADDEEKADVDEMEDEEAKELEERIKREYRAANKLRDSRVDEDEEDDDEELKKLTGAGKEMKKLVRNLDKNAAYDSDEDGNPYISEDEQEEEEPEQPPPAPESQPTPPPSQPKPSNKSSSKPPYPPRPQGSQPPSRAGSPTHGLGNSLVAHRATSPKGKSLTRPASRAASPQAPKASGSRAGSPASGASRAASPAARPPAPAAPSTPSHANNANNKRKAEEPGSAGGAPQQKKRKPTPRPIDDAFVIEWLRSCETPPTTRECIAYFKPHLAGDKAAQDTLTAVIRRVAEFKDNRLRLKVP